MFFFDRFDTFLLSNVKKMLPLFLLSSSFCPFPVPQQTILTPGDLKNSNDFDNQSVWDFLG